MTSENKESPFGKGVDWNLNACVGTNGGPYNYADYAFGYLEVANSVAKQIVESRGIGEVTLDIGIYPLLYLYRQGIELMMKHFIYDRRYSAKNDSEHDLKKLWRKSSAEIMNLLTPVMGENKINAILKKFEDFIFKMYELDPKGQVTRFPEDPFGNLFLQDYSIVNIEPIYAGGKEVESIFIFLKNALDDLSQDVDE